MFVNAKVIAIVGGVGQILTSKRNTQPNIYYIDVVRCLTVRKITIRKFWFHQQTYGVWSSADSLHFSTVDFLNEFSWGYSSTVQLKQKS